MHEGLLPLLALPVAICGVLMALWPSSIPRIERAFNRELGGSSPFSIRLGVPAEAQIESWLNSPVLSRTVSWDGWLRAHPRVCGIALLCVAACIFNISR